MREIQMPMPPMDVKRVAVHRNTNLSIEVIEESIKSRTSYADNALRAVSRFFSNDGIVVNGKRFVEEGKKDDRSVIRVWTIDSMYAGRKEAGLILGSFKKHDEPAFASVFTPQREWYVADEYGNAFLNGEKIGLRDYQRLFNLSSRYKNLEKLLPLFGASLKS